METYEFDVLLKGLAELTDEQADTLSAAGGNDGTPVCRNGSAWVHFEREGPSLKEAIKSAVAQVQAAGFTVSKVEPGYISWLFDFWLNFFRQPAVGPQRVQEYIPRLLDYWRKVAQETARRVDEEQTTLVLKLALDAVDIAGAIDAIYQEEERLNSLVYIEFISLVTKELPTFHVLFLSGQYRHVMGQLRFNWERIFYAWRADDFYRGQSVTIDDKHAWLAQKQEDDKLNWTFIVGSLKLLFKAKGEAMKKIESHYKQLWDRLNCCVHPSSQLREKMMGDFNIHLQHAFNEAWAQETLADAVEILGLIWLATRSRFRNAVPDLCSDPDLNAFRVHPCLRTALEAHTN